MANWLCHLVGCNPVWVLVGRYRVRECRRCGHVTNVIPAVQWPVPVNAEMGWTTDTEPLW